MIMSLGYLGVYTPQPEQWLSFATEIVGAMPARRVPGESWSLAGQSAPDSEPSASGLASDGSVYVKIDDWQWRIAVHPGQSGLAYLGLEVEDQLALEALQQRLEAAGKTTRWADSELLQQRAMSAILVSEDPAGNRLEFFYGPTMDFKFQSPQPGTHFKSGPLGFGHINLFVADLSASLAFYTRILGFKLSDYIRFGELGSVHFLRCNPRHHSIALVAGANLNAVHHLYFEMQDIDSVGRALDRVMRRGVKITSTLGRHINDNTLSFYMQSPLGFDVELGCEGMLIEGPWTAREFCEGDIWGHHGLTAESLQDSAQALAQSTT